MTNNRFTTFIQIYIFENFQIQLILELILNNSHMMQHNFNEYTSIIFILHMYAQLNLIFVKICKVYGTTRTFSFIHLILFHILGLIDFQGLSKLYFLFQ